MTILCSTASGPQRFVLQSPASQEVNIEAGRYYDLPDFPDHRFIVRLLDKSRRGRFIVTIHRGKERVQSATVPSLSYAIGTNAKTSDHVLGNLQLELDPNKPIFPLESLVEQLLKLTSDNHITPMSDGTTVHESIAAHADPYMQTDGALNTRHLPETNQFMEGIGFTVSGATWAILHHSGGIDHIYLWNGAADKAADILTAVRKIEAAVGG